MPHSEFPAHGLYNIGGSYVIDPYILEIYMDFYVDHTIGIHAKCLEEGMILTKSFTA